MPEDKNNIEEGYDKVRQEVEMTMQALYDKDTDLLPEYLYYLWTVWADFHLYIVLPYVPANHPPVLIKPEYDQKNRQYENVYPIVDHGYSFSTSRGEEMVTGASAMGKLYNTIKKMIVLMTERLKQHQGNEGEGESAFEPKVAIFGHELGKRKAFSLILNLEANVIVTNFEPGEWGERFMKNIREMVEQGYGYPKDLLIVDAQKEKKLVFPTDEAQPES